MTTPLLERVRQVAAEIFNLPLDEVRPESSPDTLEPWDSLQHLNLLLELEQSFRMRFSPEEIAGMRTIQNIADTIEKKTGAQAPAL